MPKKGENIYKRKDGHWEGRYKATLTNLVSRYYIVASENAHITGFPISRILLKHSASDA